MKLLTSSLSNLILGVEFGVTLSMLLVQSLMSSFSLLVIVSLIHKSVLPEVLSTSFQEFSFMLRSTCVASNRVVAGAKFFVPFDGGL